MAEPKYSIKCGHCADSFWTHDIAAMRVCHDCFRRGHRGNGGDCWKCRSDYYSSDEPFAARDDD